MSIYAKVIADSVSDSGKRLTTMEVQCHRFVLAEFNTHRRFSRNSASSRAIPFPKQLSRIDDLGIAYPLSWPAEQKGMQGGTELSQNDIDMARKRWYYAYEDIRAQAVKLHQLGVHKSVINRLLEPFMWHKIIVSATEWENFFDQRCSPLAQPELRVLAEMMRDALNASVPNYVETGVWHLPYIDDETIQNVMDEPTIRDETEALRMISAARCARVSYLTHDGKRDILVDLGLFKRLTTANPPHWSPLEHVATPDRLGTIKSNFDGWIQLRGIYERMRQVAEV
jgi:thymidylate synthase ThyX